MFFSKSIVVVLASLFAVSTAVPLTIRAEAETSADLQTTDTASTETLEDVAFFA
ncbi:uncharacterized protein LY89DRAFT_690383 [Mollisia scopiformis]|uniref:Uncharacterized protein n=1 Tax=Mollisia scopiformis TaxID=149040 RepID=A0A132BAB0_MOLSC|nr:uncharacterized protein LY89DRAFT_690383 [Mollisia scopiformis]KUJ09338.1 hypothetical protein LY89DRAFT_690383 [Mollisia scopiformis]